MSCVQPYSCSTAWHNVFLTFVPVAEVAHSDNAEWLQWWWPTLQSCFQVQCIVMIFCLQTVSFMQLLLNYIGRPWYCNQCAFFMQSVRFFKMRNSNRGILSSLWSVKMPQNAPILYTIKTFIGGDTPEPPSRERRFQFLLLQPYICSTV